MFTIKNTKILLKKIKSTGPDDALFQIYNWTRKKYQTTLTQLKLLKPEFINNQTKFLKLDKNSNKFDK